MNTLNVISNHRYNLQDAHSLTLHFTPGAKGPHFVRSLILDDSFSIGINKINLLIGFSKLSKLRKFSLIIVFVLNQLFFFFSYFYTNNNLLS